MIYFNDSFGIRGDCALPPQFQGGRLRFRPDLEFERGTFNFGRATVGALFRSRLATHRPGRAHSGPPAACAAVRTLRRHGRGYRFKNVQRASILPIVSLWLAGVGLAGLLGFAAGARCGRAVARTTSSPRLAGPRVVRPRRARSGRGSGAVRHVGARPRAPAWVTLSAGAAHLSGLPAQSTRVKPEALHARVCPLDMPRVHEEYEAAIARRRQLRARVPSAGRGRGLPLAPQLRPRRAGGRPASSGWSARSSTSTTSGGCSNSCAKTPTAWRWPKTSPASACGASTSAPTSCRCRPARRTSRGSTAGALEIPRPAAVGADSSRRSRMPPSRRHGGRSPAHEVYKADFRITRPDGGVRWVRSQGRVDRENGEPSASPAPSSTSRASASSPPSCARAAERMALAEEAAGLRRLGSATCALQTVTISTGCGASTICRSTGPSSTRSTRSPPPRDPQHDGRR